MVAAWTFRSGHVAPDRAQVLPLSAIRFAPPVDARNVAPAGRTVTVPVTVQRQSGSAAAKVRTLAVEVSYDDGSSWLPVPLKSTSDGWDARLTHPAGGGHFVALRAAMTDTAGNTAELTVRRAYLLG
jgi:hypothetical protein